jgi:hypothetical protein
MDKNNIYQESVKEKLTFSPIDKYVKYDRFPFKLLIHILLVILTTIATISMAIGSNSRSKSQQAVWFQLVGLGPEDPRNHIYTINQLQTHLNDTVENIINLDSIVYQDIDKNEAKYSINVEYLFPGSHLSQNVDPEFIHKGNIFKYDIPNIKEGITYPFNLQDIQSLKNFAQKIKSFTFNADNIRLRQTHNDENIFSCWKLQLTYEMYSYSHIMASFKTMQKNCDEGDDDGSMSGHENKKSGMFLKTEIGSKRIKGHFVSDPHGEINPFGRTFYRIF